MINKIIMKYIQCYNESKYKFFNVLFIFEKILFKLTYSLLTYFAEISKGVLLYFLSHKISNCFSLYDV